MIFTDGYTYLGLNATLVNAVTVVVVLLAVGLLIMASGVVPEAAGKIQRYSQEFFPEDIFVDAEQEDVQNRYKRFADNGKVFIFHFEN